MAAGTSNPVGGLSITSPVEGGSQATGSVQLNSPAPSGGLTVNLASSNPAVVTVPASVNVPQGQRVQTFSVGTMAVVQSTSVTITGSPNVTPGSVTVNP